MAVIFSLQPFCVEELNLQVFYWVTTKWVVVKEYYFYYYSEVGEIECDISYKIHISLSFNFFFRMKFYDWSWMWGILGYQEICLFTSFSWKTFQFKGTPVKSLFDLFLEKFIHYYSFCFFSCPLFLSIEYGYDYRWKWCSDQPNYGDLGVCKNGFLLVRVNSQ